MTTIPRSRDEVLSLLDDYAAVGDQETCSAQAHEFEQLAARHRAAGLSGAGWLQDIATAHECRAAAIDHLLQGRIADALQCEETSEQVLGLGPGDVLTLAEIQRLADDACDAFWRVVGEAVLDGINLAEELHDTITVEQLATVQGAARKVLHELCWQLTSNDDDEEEL